MPVDTRDLIAKAAVSLLMDKKVKKLTVKDIVESCNITRQTFYYHFADIPDLLEWMLDRESENFMRETLAQGDAEGGLRYLILLYLQARPLLTQGMKSNYGDEVERILREKLFELAEKISDIQGLYAHCSRQDRRLILRYHCMAIMGTLQNWTEEDTKNLDHNVHLLYLLLTGGISAN